MANHHIKMSIVNGQIVFVPGSKVSAPAGDKIRWQSKDGGFTVAFKTESPFETGAGAPENPPIISVDGSSTALQKLKAIVTVKKRFPYTVTLGGITEDPEIIIDNSAGSGGHTKKGQEQKKK